ncbi:hypothetical protein PHYBOEH_001934 [Phytophthora boehmeriae]|uniref:Uncharacterized protein n=1 Tax=Phytophthora boehmeriae TaxID=109152 RepID=A0A8T1WYP2_9STRA|nr:hypothetical protein PHYBOEH_001934 [Phytophthora boehmeriae]
MPRPFPRFELSEKDCRRFHTQATELLANALAEYEEHALVRHRQVDKKRWRLVKHHESLSVYRESRSYAHVSRSLSAEEEGSFSRASGLAPSSTPSRRRSSRSSSSSGGSAGSNSGSGSISKREKPVVSELDLLTGWGPTATEVREQKKRAKTRSVSSAIADSEELPMLFGVGSVIGSLDDVMYGIAAPDCASMALKNAYSHEDVLDGDVLCGIEGPSQRSPFRFLGIKWLVKTAGGTKQRFVSPRDLVYLEATGVITRGDGVRVGYQIMHSVTLPGCPELLESHGIVRSRCEGVHLFVELNDKMVDVYLKSKVTPNGRISESAALQSCAYSLLGRSSRDEYPVDEDEESIDLDSSGGDGRQAPVRLYNTKEIPPYTPRDESMGKATCSSSSSIASNSEIFIDDEEPESEIDEARDTFDSFGDLIEPIDDLEDVDEMLDTRDMEAVLRRSQQNRNLWQQMAELRDAAENVYQYTKASPAAKMAIVDVALRRGR